MKPLEKENRIYVLIGFLLLLCGIAYLAIDRYVFKVYLPANDCIFHRVFGLYCPGCGGTRAVKALLTGHFIASFRFHIAVPISALLYVCFMGSNLLHMLFPKVKAMPFREGYLWLVLGLIVFNFLLRNFLLLVFQIAI